MRILLLLLVVAVTSFSQPIRYALIIGQNNGGPTVNKLRYAERDAQRIAAVLRGLGEFSKENSTLLLSPDSSEINEHIQKIAGKIKARGEQNRALFLLYYSGHADENSLLLSKTRFSLEKLQAVISHFPSAFRIAIFDACQSGAVTAYKGGKRAEPFYLQNSGSLVKGQVIIASASANERALESETLKGSIFTFHLINGLNGSADVSSDNQVTLNEVYQYAYRKTIETSALSTGEVQHPVYRFNITGQGEIVLANLGKSEAGIVIGGDCEGKFLVLSEDYLNVYADFFKERKREVFVSLQSGKYTIVNARGRDVGTYSFVLKKKSAFRITSSMFIPNTITESRIKGKNNVDTNDLSFEPQRQYTYSPGIGAGFFFLSKKGEELDNDFNIQLTNDFFINERISMYANLVSLISKKSGGLNLGIDFKKSNGVSDLYLGTGLGAEYKFRTYSYFRDAFSPLLNFHAGFITEIGKNTSLKVQIPFTMVLKEEIVFRLGVDLSVMLKGF